MSARFLQRRQFRLMLALATSVLLLREYPRAFAADLPPSPSIRWRLERELATLGKTTLVSFSLDNKRLMSASYPMGLEQQVQLFDVATGANQSNFEGAGRGALSPDGRFLATVAAGRIEIWKLQTGDKQAMLAGHDSPFTVSAIAYSPGGGQIATAGYDQTLRLWDAATGRPIAVLRGHDNWVYDVSYSSDGRSLVSASRDGTARIWDTATFEERRSVAHGVAPHGIRSAILSTDSKRLATACSDGTIKLWDAATGVEQHNLTGHTEMVYRVAFHPDGKTLLSASADGTARLLNVATGESHHTFRDHKDQVTSVAFSPDGTRMATGSYDETIRLYVAP
ncbi:MAG: WD40 repeat domain-containing protein [Planctomycetales bacterium]